MAIIVPILTQFDDSGINKAIREFERAKGAIDKFSAVGSGFKAVGTSLTQNLTLPIAGVVTALGLMVRGAIDAESSQARLKKLLTNTSGATKSEIDLLIKQASALEKVGVASKNNIITTMSQLATFDLSGSTISKLTPAILDYVLAEKGAAATSDDFKSMTNGLAQALNGQFGSLSRIGFVLDEETKKKIKSGTESERAAALVQVLNSTYKDFNKSLLDTPAGQLEALKRDFGDMKNEIGVALMPVMLDFVKLIRTDLMPIVQNAANYVKDLVAKFQGLSEGTKKQIALFVGIAAALGPVLYVLGPIITSLATLIKVFRALSLALTTNPIGIVIALLGLLAYAVYKAWTTSDKFRQGIAKLGNALISLAEIVVNVVIKYFNLWIKQFNNVIGVLNFFGINIKKIGEIGEVSFGRLSFASIDAGKKVSGLSDEASGLGSTLDGDLNPNLDDTKAGLTGAATATDKATEGMKKMREAAKKAAQAVVDNLENALRKAESSLEDIRGKFNDFKGAVAGSISGVLNFGKAAERGDFLGGLRAQAEDAKSYADRIKKLIQMGLNERALRQVMDAGIEAGSLIADSIIAGGSSVVNQVNTLVDSVTTLADQVGTMGAENFYQAGIDQGQNIVDGIKAALERARAELQALIDSLPSVGGGADSGLPSSDPGKPKPKPKPKFKPKPSLQISNKIKQMTESTRFAKGGIVTGPTNALIGEAGPEAVIPLSGANSAKVGNNFNITVNAGIGTNGALVGKQIVEAIKKYEKTSGQVFAGA
jgi:hypothetical protein